MKMRRLLILLAVAAISFGASGCGYNTLTTKHENVKGKWANTETQLQRRSDLLNNLAESAKMAGIQEQEVFGKIAEARSRLLNATSQAPQGEAGRQITRTKTGGDGCREQFRRNYRASVGATGSVSAVEVK